MVQYRIFLPCLKVNIREPDYVSTSERSSLPLAVFLKRKIVTVRTLKKVTKRYGTLQNVLPYAELTNDRLH